jgi:hypothetical protein
MAEFYSLMELVTEPDMYEPTVDERNNYTDVVPPSSKFKNGMVCPCGTRGDHRYDNRNSFLLHVKSKTHSKWLSNLNLNKTNYYAECEKLKIVVHTQKLIIAGLEKERSYRVAEERKAEDSDLISFD